MGINDLYNAGEDLVDAVNDAVRRNDYSGLSESIKKTVKDVSETIQRMSGSMMPGTGRRTSAEGTTGTRRARADRIPTTTTSTGGTGRPQDRRTDRG